MSFWLRPYEDADWPALLALWIESWTATRPGIDFSARAPWLAELFKTSRFDGAQIVVAEDMRGLLGFVLFNATKNWLEQIAVIPRAFGSGAAQALIGKAKQACPEGFGLDVNADNERALAFYRGEGFLRTGEGSNPRSGLPIVALRWTPDGSVTKVL
jgi:putative acetyltransferase